MTKIVDLNPNWKVTSLGRRDIYGPIRVANTQAQAAVAEGNQEMRWANDFAGAADMVSDTLMQRYEQSNNEEVMTRYNQAMGEINELETAVYNQDSFAMDSPHMQNVDYDDSVTVYDANGVGTVSNTGQAPTHEMGIKVWQANVNDIVSRATVGAGNKVIAGQVSAKLQQIIMQKNPAISGHVQKLAKADKRAQVTKSIADSVRVGDLQGAVDINNEALKRGIIDLKIHGQNEFKALQTTELQNFNEALVNTTDEAILTKMANDVMFDEGYMTPEQKLTNSKKALAKVNTMDAEKKAAHAEWEENNEISAIIDDELGTLTKAELIKNRHKYDRAGFARLMTRVNKKDPKVGSDPTVFEDYDRKVSFMHFNATPGFPVDVQQKVVLAEMHKSVLSGALLIEDYNAFKTQMEDQNKEQFRAQPYKEAKETLFTGILATLSPSNMVDIENAGMNMSGFMLSAMGQDKNVAALAMGAFNDLNTYMRSSGSKADPMQWWSDNKDQYTKSKSDMKHAELFSTAYPADTITDNSGKVDIQATKKKILDTYPKGPIRDERMRVLTRGPSNE